MNYTIQSGVGLDGLLDLELMGWEGAGWGKVCLRSGWDSDLGEGQYGFVVDGMSVLYDTLASASFSFTVLPRVSSSVSPSPSPSPSGSCTPDLWDDSPVSVYGVEIFPGGLTFLPSSLRSSPLHITTKALSPCSIIEMSKDILSPSMIRWTFVSPIPVGLVGVDPNDWTNGTQMVIPQEILEDREAFPPNEGVGIQVNVTFELDESEGGGVVSFLADTFVQFLYSPVEVVTTPR